MFQKAGKKGELHADPEDPPRRRANKQGGQGTEDHDRPLIVGTVGRESGPVPLRVVHHTDRKPLEAYVHRFTLKETTGYTDECNSYNHIVREHKTVCHTEHEGARDDDSDGIREVHTNTAEGLWTDIRNYLRAFKGVHKGYLSGYVAMPSFVEILNAFHLSSSLLSWLFTWSTSEPQEYAQGQVLDLAHGQPYYPSVDIYVGSKQDYADAHVIVITAGAKQAPGETRLELLQKNSHIVEGVVDEIVAQNSQAVLVVASNPVDVLTYVALKRSGWPKNRVIGSGTVLDSARFRYLLSQHCNVDVGNVHAYILGEHGDSEFTA